MLLTNKVQMGKTGKTVGDSVLSLHLHRIRELLANIRVSTFADGSAKVASSQSKKLNNKQINKSTMKYFSDGFLSSMYPNNKGGGYTVVDLSNNLIIRFDISKPGITNNEVELLGCHYALGIAQDGDTVSVDSKNTIRWIENIEYIISHPRSHVANKRARKDLDSIKFKCSRLIDNKNIKLIWEPREVNFAGILNDEIRTRKES